MLGVLALVWVVQRAPVRIEEMRDVNAAIDTVHVMGNTALLVLALLALNGERRGHGLVRALSGVMIAALCVAMLLAWKVSSAYAAAYGEAAAGILGGVVLISTVIQVGPWLLYLRLFRTSRYP